MDARASRFILLVMCQEAANCRQQALNICVVDAAARCSRKRIFKLTFTCANRQNLCLLCLSHSEHVSCGSRQLALERLDQSRRCDLVEQYSFIPSLKFQRSMRPNSSQQWHPLVHRLALLFHMAWRHGFCIASRSPDSTGPNDAICTDPLRAVADSNPSDLPSPEVPAELVMVVRSKARQARQVRWAERYAAGHVTGHETDVEISMNQDCRLCLQPRHTAKLRWNAKMNNIDDTINW